MHELELKNPELLFEEPVQLYGVPNLIFKEEVYSIIGVCMEVHRILGKGFSEVVYKDAIQYEFEGRKICFEREKKFNIQYKDTTLSHHYFADFVYEDKIILEIKAQQNVADAHYRQTINYLAASKYKLGLIVNFGEDSLKFKRVIL